MRFALVLLPVSIAIFASLGAATHATGSNALAAVWTERTAGWLMSLDEGQRARTLHRFDDDERFDLRLAPMGLEGLRLDQMNEAQRASLHDALAAVLSRQGLQKVDTIRSLEREVAETDPAFLRVMAPGFRDPLRYFTALFGEPQHGEPWGLRFDGHHVSLNWTAVPGAPLSVTPLFLGGQPREVPAGFERAGLRALAEEEDRALALISALEPEQDAIARQRFRWSRFGRPMFVGEEATLELDEPVGIARSALTASQQRLFDAISEATLSNFVRPIAERHRQRFAAQRQSLHFAYAARDGAEPLRGGDPLYYRIHGDLTLIEFDNTGAAADHIHLVWRQLYGDFGRDLLAEHYLNAADHADGAH